MLPCSSIRIQVFILHPRKCIKIYLNIYLVRVRRSKTLLPIPSILLGVPRAWLLSDEAGTCIIQASPCFSNCLDILSRGASPVAPQVLHSSRTVFANYRCAALKLAGPRSVSGATERSPRAGSVERNGSSRQGGRVENEK